MSDTSLTNSTSVSFTWTVDNIAPTVVNLAYDAPRMARSSSLRPRACAFGSSDPGDESLQVVVNDLPAHGTLVLAGDGSFVYSPERFFTGVDSFTFSAFDGLNYGAPGTVTLHVADTTPPVVHMTAPPDGSSITSTTPTLSADATDPVAMANVQFQLSENGGASWIDAGPPQTVEPYHVFTSTLAIGSYEARAIATNSVGLSTTSASISFIVSTGVSLTGVREPSSHSGYDPNDGITNVTEPTYMGMAAAGDLVRLFHECWRTVLDRPGHGRRQ